MNKQYNTILKFVLFNVLFNNSNTAIDTNYFDVVYDSCHRFITIYLYSD